MRREEKKKKACVCFLFFISVYYTFSKMCKSVELVAVPYRRRFESLFLFFASIKGKKVTLKQDTEIEVKLDGVPT